MIHSKIEFDKDIKLFEKFNKYANLSDLLKKLQLVSNKSQHNEINELKDRLEGLMHSEGAGSIIYKDISLPQISQRILIHLEHFKDLK